MSKNILTLLEKDCFDNYGDGNGNGYGDGSGWSNGYGNGYGWGDGDSIGGGDGCGDGCNNGYSGNGPGIIEINGMKVYDIDCVQTAVEAVFGAYAKGYTVDNGVTLTPCYVAMDGTSLAHGSTLKEAFRDARIKEMIKLPEEKRVKRFVAEHPDPEENLPNEELFYIHHILTGSCEFGRREFCRKNNIDLESSMSISEFIALTENKYGRNVIKKIKEEYLHQAKSVVPETRTFAL